MTTLQVDGHEVFVLEVGDGEATPLVCLHSTGLGSFQWRRLARRAAKQGRRVFAPDLLGYGETGRWLGDRPFRTEDDDAVVAAVAAHVGRPFHLVGHSYGGRLALRAALDRPAEVVSLGLFEPVAFGVLRSTDDRAGLDDLESSDRDGKFLDDEFGGTQAWMERFVEYWSGPGAWREMSESQRRLWMASARKIFEEVRDTVHDPIGIERYASLTTPTLLMCGGASRMSGRRVCALLAQTMPNARVLELADGVHMSPLVHGDDVNLPMLAHLAEVDVQASG